MDWTDLVNTTVLAGWVRAGVASAAAALIARYPGLNGVVDPVTQTAIATAAAGIVVGIWSHIAKKITPAK